MHNNCLFVYLLAAERLKVVVLRVFAATFPVYETELMSVQVHDAVIPVLAKNRTTIFNEFFFLSSVYN